ncbi:MAG TPA: hypothetical protein VFV23_12825 [Verrucomicrobiae bacterium]|nr:hypothetical protein [Verrucomicrobiae bacterium]
MNTLKGAIFLRYGCDAKHRESVHVRETLRDGQVVWEGDVEVFDLIDFPGANGCCTWCKGNVDTLSITTVLFNHLIDTPEKAVQAAIFAGRENPIPPDLFISDANIHGGQPLTRFQNTAGIFRERTE